MNNQNYITIQGWMINGLNIKGNELILFALIYGFSQNRDSEYKGSLNYMSQGLKLSKPAIINIINKLTKKNYIIKMADPTGNRFKHNEDFINDLLGSNQTLLVRNSDGSSNQTLPLASKETLPNNYDINNNNNYKKNKSKKNTKIKFEDSPWSDYEKLRLNLGKDLNFVKNYKRVDLPAYIESVKLWAEGGNTDGVEKLRTERGWFSTLRQFMRTDKEKHKLKYILKETDEPRNAQSKDLMKQNKHTTF